MMNNVWKIEDVEKKTAVMQGRNDRKNMGGVELKINAGKKSMEKKNEISFF